MLLLVKSSLNSCMFLLEIAISGGGEASVGDGSVESTDCKNRQTIRDCVLPDRKRQQRDSKLMGREFGEAFRSC